ncbi:MAG: DUF3429 domain-containing protein [Rhodobacteraceae bacterium]|nr:MAG: DUF3429 domain-containing protein [Paracoccaceae bacterium]
MIPRSALALGLAGLLPFFFGLATLLSPALRETTEGLIGPRFTGPYVLISYGSVILSFMSGVLWGFAARGEMEHHWRGYALSTVPALWVFFMVGGGPSQALSALLIGFVGLLRLDWQFRLWGLAPDWWMRLRLILTAGVVLCLALGLWLG